MTGSVGLLGHILKERNRTKEAAAHFTALGKADGKKGFVEGDGQKVPSAKELNRAGYEHLILKSNAEVFIHTSFCGTYMYVISQVPSELKRGWTEAALCS